MKHITSKLLSLLLTLAMLLSMIPAAYAAGTEGTTEGSTSTEKVVAKVGETTATTETLNGSTTVTGTNAATADDKGTSAIPYTRDEFEKMTRAEYIAAQARLGGTMYVTVGDYSYGTNGVLGNGERNDKPGQTEDRNVLNGYNSNGYLNEDGAGGKKNDGANGKNIVFVGGKITSDVTGYTSIDNIGTSLLLAVPAYTNVTFKGTTFNHVMSFDYQLYTSPWSQLGELKFDGCTFNGIIVGAIAAQKLTFNSCAFNDYTNTVSANNSNPTWIRPAYGNWTKGDNEGQGGNFKSLTTINFTGNTVTSTRPVKFEYISQWDIRSKVTATDNYFDISRQETDKATKIKNVGLYLGAHTNANAFDLVADNNKKSDNTAALYTIPEGKTSLPAGSTVKDSKGNDTTLTDALKWKTTTQLTLETQYVAEVGGTKYPTLAEAIAAAKDGDTVKLLADTDITSNGLTIAKGKSITLDLSGHSLKAANTNNGNIKVLGTLTLTDSTDTAKDGTGRGKVYTETSYIYGSQDKVLIAAIDGGTFIMESGLIDAASFTEDNTHKGQFAVSVQNEKGDAAVIINGGKIKAGWYAVAGNGNDTSYSGDITVNGGILESTADYAIYHPHTGTTTINGGTVYGAAGGVSLNRGKLVVNGGTITSKGTGTTGDWGDGTGKQDAAAINVNAQYEATSVEIKGGTITAENDAIVLTNGRDGTIAVSGGTFSNNVKDEYCAPGFVPKMNDDSTYGVKIKEDMVAEVLDAQGNTVAAYDTLAAAITAAKNGDTVKLLKDVTENVTIPANKTITLDLNGKNIAVTSGCAIVNKGTLTVTGSGNVTTSANGSEAVANFPGATANLNGGTYSSSKWYVIKNLGTMTIDGPVTVKKPDGSTDTSSLIDNGWVSNEDTVAGESVGAQADKAKLTIKNGAFEGKSGSASCSVVKNDDYGVLEITGGTFDSTNNVETSNATTILNWNVATISGGTFKGSYPISNGSYNKEADQGLLTISGGNFIGTSSLFGQAQGGTRGAGKVTITDGNFEAPQFGAFNYAVEISGGTFSFDPSTRVKNNGKDYIVKRAGSEGAYTYTVLAKSGLTSGVYLTNPSGALASNYYVSSTANGVWTVSYSAPYSGGSSSYDPTYSVSTPSKTENGSVTVSPKSASKGDTVTVTVKPDSGYVLETLTVTDKNGNELTLKDKGDGKYTFTMPAGKVEVKATFMEDNSVLNFFYDVPNDAYFYEAVKWAVKNGITDGVGDNLFAPGQPCTCAQIVTFLWRAAGSPAPKSTMSFADVPAGSYYAKAVAWAVENGITLGTGDGTFSPNATCTRAQSVTFLYRALGTAPATANGFTDVAANAFYTDAVAWAVENGVTNGTTDSTFSPDNGCTRAQIVTFLFRAYQGK